MLLQDFRGQTGPSVVISGGIDRVLHLLPEEWVGPGQVSWFSFTVKAPQTLGTYRLYLRPVIEGATWMEDYGVFWLITVK